MKYNISILKRERLLVHDDNVDIEVVLENGEVYSATLFTLKNITTLLAEYKTTGECANGLYFWASDMILVDDLKDETIKKIMDDLVGSGELKYACTKIA